MYNVVNDVCYTLDAPDDITHVDFIFVHWKSSYFPAFNVADSAITLGAIMMVVEILFLDREGRDAHPAG